MLQQLPQKLSLLLLQEWDTVLYIGRMAVRWLLRHAETGIYEVLDYDSTLELLDSRGENAVFKRKQKVRFLQNDVIAYQDHAWGDGDILAGYECSPGVVADCYQDGDRWNILISLRETKNRGDVEDIYITRRVKNGFTEDEEWRQIEVWYTIKQLKIAVIFPQDRPCQRAVLQPRRSNKTIPLGPEHFRTLPDGRQILTWEKKNPRRAEVYTLRWKW